MFLDIKEDEDGKLPFWRRTMATIGVVSINYTVGNNWALSRWRSQICMTREKFSCEEDGNHHLLEGYGAGFFNGRI